MSIEITQNDNQWDTINEKNIHVIVFPINERRGIYIGNIQAAKDKQLHQKYNIKSVLTVETNCQIKYFGSEQILFHKVIPINLLNCGDLFKSFYDSYMFIQDSINYGNILIHCMDCITISPVFSIAYMLQQYGHTVETAWNIIKIQNPSAEIRHQFFQQLLLYERSLNLDIYLGQPNNEGKELRNIEIKEMNRIEKIREREQNKKAFIKNIYQKYHMEYEYEVNYEELRKKYSKNYK